MGILIVILHVLEMFRNDNVIGVYMQFSFTRVRELVSSENFDFNFNFITKEWIAWMCVYTV